MSQTSMESIHIKVLLGKCRNGCEMSNLKICWLHDKVMIYLLGVSAWHLNQTRCARSRTLRGTLSPSRRGREVMRVSANFWRATGESRSMALRWDRAREGLSTTQQTAVRREREGNPTNPTVASQVDLSERWCNPLTNSWFNQPQSVNSIKPSINPRMKSNTHPAAYPSIISLNLGLSLSRMANGGCFLLSNT